MAKDRGYRTVTVRADLERLGFGKNQRNVPALLAPLCNVRGEVASFQLRPDQPRAGKDGKVIEYELLATTAMFIDVPVRSRARLGDPAVPLWITDGACKADSAISRGMCCIALIGTWNWRGKNAKAWATALGDLQHIALKERDVFLTLDSDVSTNSEKHAAARRLGALLTDRGARVRIVHLPSREDGRKVGIDDFLASGREVADLLALASELREQGPEEAGSDEQPLRYRAQPGRSIVWEKETRDGSVDVYLTNFSARIVAEIVEDDGVEQRRQYEIEAVRGEQFAHVTVATAEYGSMNWPSAQLGPEWILNAGMGIRDHARAAIQHLSQDIERRTTYTHTGWRQIDGAWVYLHGAGALGAVGPVPGIDVRLPGGMSKYELPAPSSGADLEADVRAVLRILSLGHRRNSIALLGAVFRAVLGGADFYLFLSGVTGVQKSQLAALGQQFFGPRMTAQNLPGCWESTANALEAMAFTAKDAVFVVDDFVPKSGKADVQQLHAKADRLLRGQGNGSGRARMTADASIREGKPPRGVIISTGEDVPSGQSLRARGVFLEMGPEKLDSPTLSGCQRDAADGAYARVMAAFVVWMAARYEVLQGWRKERARELRDARLETGGHARAPSNFAEIEVGFSAFLMFAIDAGVLRPEECQDLHHELDSALEELAGEQADLQQHSEVTTVFLELLQSALGAGLAHLVAPNGSRPASDDLGGCGWRTGDSDSGSGPDYTPLGVKVGWLDGDHVYLDLRAALSIAQRLADESHRIAVGVKTLGKRLAQRGLLVTTDAGRDKNTVRRQIEGRRRSVHHLRASLLLGEASPLEERALGAQWAQTPLPDSAEADGGPESWARNTKAGDISGPRFGPTTPLEGGGNGAQGPKGPLGPFWKETSSLAAGEGETPEERVEDAGWLEEEIDL